MNSKEKKEGLKETSGNEADFRNDEITDGAAARESEVSVPVKRHRYTESYKQKVVAKVSEMRENGSGQIGSYLRQEGIYYSMVMKWEKKQKGENSSSSSKDKSSREALEQKVKSLQKELEQTKKKLLKSEMLVELQKKISQIMSLEED